MASAGRQPFARVHLRGLAGQDTLIRADSVQALYREMRGYRDSNRLVGYAGSAGTFKVYLELRPTQQQAIVLMTNAGDSCQLRSGHVLDALMKHVAHR